MRRYVRPPRSKYNVGQVVKIDGDASGDYIGSVIETHGKLKKICLDYEGSKTQPGMTVKVSWWDGNYIDYDMEIIAWDSEVIG